MAGAGTMCPATRAMRRRLHRATPMLPSSMQTTTSTSRRTASRNGLAGGLLHHTAEVLVQILLCVQASGCDVSYNQCKILVHRLLKHTSSMSIRCMQKVVLPVYSLREVCLALFTGHSGDRCRMDFQLSLDRGLGTTSISRASRQPKNSRLGYPEDIIVK